MESRLKGIEQKTLDFYGVTEDKDLAITFPYANSEGNVVAFKVRSIDKKFHFKGNTENLTLFGMNKFPSGGKFITVTEGEGDCLAAYEMMGSKWPVVSIRSLQQTLSEAEYKYLNSFDNIVLNFDSDEPGQKAVRKLAQMFPLGKAKILKLREAKDADEYRQKGFQKRYLDEWWKAEAYKPQGLVYGRNTWELLEKDDHKETLPYPWKGLNGVLTGVYTPQLVVVSAGSGVGKCFAKNTEVILYNGKTKFVQDIVVGDLLMGPDSTRRKVLSVHSGKSTMYDIIPVKGEKFSVNGEHTLYVQDTRTKKYAEYSVKEYLSLPSTVRTRQKLVRSETINFPANAIALDPYFLGLWLGDGHSKALSFTNADKKLFKYWQKYVTSFDLENKKCTNLLTTRASSGRFGPKKGRNPLLNIFNRYSLLNGKHIPYEFKVTSEENRLKLLAGIIDTDGHLIHNCYEITQKNSTLAEDIVFVARSLGFGVTIRKVKKGCQTGAVGEYFRIFISGDIARIPVLLSYKKGEKRKQIKNPLRTGFTVAQKPQDEYFGFEVDKDHLFLLKDFTVVHNSQIIKEIMYDLVKRHQEKVGCAFLEESVRRSVQDFVSIEMSKNLRLPETEVSTEDKEKAWKSLMEQGKFIFWDHFGGADIDTVEEQLRYMAKGFGAKYIILDHISMLVSGGDQGDERKALDAIMTRLRKMVQELNICLFVVSHLKRPDGTPHEEGGVTSLAQLRGSHAIAQLADTVLGLERNGQDEDLIVRNTTTIRVLKNRLTGETGPATHLLWNRETARLKETFINEQKEEEEKTSDEKI